MFGWSSKRILIAALAVATVSALSAGAGENSYYFRYRSQVAAPMIVSPEVPTEDTVIGGVDPELHISEPLIATVGLPYVLPYQATNVNAIASVGAFPPGLVIDVSSRTISGTPTQAGNYAFELRGYARTSLEVRKGNSNRVAVEVRPPLSVSISASTLVMVGDTLSIKIESSQPEHSTYRLLNAPDWLSVVDGRLVGTPPAAGSWKDVYIEARNEIGHIANRSFTVTAVGEPQVVYPVRSLIKDVAATIRPSGITPNSTVTLESGSVPAGMTLAANGEISGTPIELGMTYFSARVTRGTIGSSVSGPFVVDVVPAPISVDGGEVSRAYVGFPLEMARQPSASGGTSPLLWQATNLPIGLTIDPTSGNIRGSAEGAGNAVVGLRVIDSVGRQGQGTLEVRSYGPKLSIPFVPDTMVGRSLASAGGVVVSVRDARAPITWAVEGAPSWLSLSPLSGTASTRLTGTPSTAQDVAFEIQATDASGVKTSGSVAFRVHPRLEISPPVFGASAIGLPLVVEMQPVVSGGDGSYRWSLDGPDWMSINPLNGILTGTIGDQSGSFTLRVDDGAGNSAKSTLSADFIDPRSAGMSLAAPELGTAFVGQAIPIVTQPRLTGGVEPFTWSMTGGDDGLSIDASSGILTAVPTTRPGNSQHDITVVDVNGGSASIRVSSTTYAPLSLTAPILAETAAGAPVIVTRQPSVTGGKPPMRWTSDDLPDGISVDRNSGSISGRPKAVGASTFGIHVSDSEGNVATTSASLTTVLKPLVLNEPIYDTPYVGRPLTMLSQPSASGGLPPYQWSLDGSADWLSVNEASGLLEGTVGEEAVSSTLWVRDAAGQFGSASLLFLPMLPNSDLVIDVRPTATTPQYSGRAFSMDAQPHASGGDGAYVWSLLDPIPQGLVIDSTTGAVSGTVPDEGAWLLKVAVSDGSGRTTSATTPFQALSDTLAVVVPTLSAAYVDHPITTTIPAAARNATGPLSWSLKDNPSWLSIGSDGRLIGVPSGAGTFTYTVVGLDTETGKEAQASGSLTIGEYSLRAPEFGPSNIGHPLLVSTSAAVIGGIGPFKWDVIDGPAWLVIDPVNGRLSGSVEDATAGFTLRVTDAVGVSRSVSLTINAAQMMALIGPTISYPIVAGTPIPVVSQATVSGGVAPYSWSASGKPSWLLIDTSTGTISGTPTMADRGRTNVTLRATDAEGRVATSAISLIVNGFTVSAPVLSTSFVDHPVVTTRVATATDAEGVVTWSLEGAPEWLSISSSGSLSGTPRVAGDYSVRLIGMDSSSGRVAAVDMVVAVGAYEMSAPVLSSVQTVGSALSVVEQASLKGGIGPFTWSLVGAPDGIDIDAGTGAISGLVRTTMASFTLRIVDAIGVERSKSLSFTASPALTVLGPSTLPTEVRQALKVETQASVAGGRPPYAWTMSNEATAPAWLTLDKNSGRIGGLAPTGSDGTHDVILTVTDADGRNSSVPVSVVIYDFLALTPPNIVASVMMPVQAQTVQQPEVRGGLSPYAWSLTGGPSWLTIDGSTGRLTGIPDIEGQHDVEITVTDAIGNDISVGVRFVVGPRTVPDLVLDAPAIRLVQTVGTEFAVTTQASASGGFGTKAWSLEGAPEWLRIDASSGVLSGLIETVGSFSATLRVSDETGASLTSQINFTAENPLVMSFPTPTFTSGTAGSFSGVVSGGLQPYVWSASGALPQGLSLNTSSGEISGAPTTVATSSVTISVTDARQRTVSRDITISVKKGLTITQSFVGSPASVGVAWTATTTGSNRGMRLSISGGSTPYTTTLEGAPEWLTVVQGNSPFLVGTPTEPGDWTFTARVTDSAGAEGTIGLSVSATFPLVLNPPVVPTTYIGVPFKVSSQPNATGGRPPYSWTMTSGNGLAVNATTGEVSQTKNITSPTTVTGTLTVRDADTRSVTTALTIPVIGLSIAPGNSVDVLPNSVITSSDFAFGPTTVGNLDVSVSGDGNPEMQVRTTSNPWVKTASIPAGTTFRVRTTSSTTPSETRNVIISTGEFTKTWSVTTRVQDLIPDNYKDFEKMKYNYYSTNNGGQYNPVYSSAEMKKGTTIYAKSEVSGSGGGGDLSSNMPYTFLRGYDAPLELSVSGTADAYLSLDGKTWSKALTVTASGAGQGPRIYIKIILPSVAGQTVSYTLKLGNAEVTNTLPYPTVN